MERSEQARATPVGYDSCNGNLNFKFKEDGKQNKVTISAKSGRDADELARIAILLVSRCEQGAPLPELLQYRDDLMKMSTEGLKEAEKVETRLAANVRFSPGAIVFFGPAGEKYALGGRTKPTVISFEAGSRALSFSFQDVNGKKREVQVKINPRRDAEEWIHIMILLQAKCSEGASFDALSKHRTDLLTYEAASLREEVLPHRDKADLSPGLVDIINAELQKQNQAKKKVSGRATSITFDKSNSNLMFQFKLPDGKTKKITAHTRLGFKKSTRAIALLAVKCNDGAEFEQLASYREELFQADPDTIESSLDQALSDRGIEFEGLFSENALPRAEACCSGSGPAKDEAPEGEGKDSVPENNEKGPLNGEEKGSLDKKKNKKKRNEGPLHDEKGESLDKKEKKEKKEKKKRKEAAPESSETGPLHQKDEESLDNKKKKRKGAAPENDQTGPLHQEDKESLDKKKKKKRKGAAPETNETGPLHDEDKESLDKKKKRKQAVPRDDDTETSKKKKTLHEEKKSPRKNKDEARPYSLVSVDSKGAVVNAVVMKGRDPGMKHATVNGIYAPLPETLNADKKAYKNISVEKPRVLHYDSHEQRWKISQKLGQRKYFAYLSDPIGKGSPLDVDPKSSWYFYDDKADAPDTAVQCVLWNATSVAGTSSQPSEETKDQPPRSSPSKESADASSKGSATSSSSSDSQSGSDAEGSGDEKGQDEDSGDEKAEAEDSDGDEKGNDSSNSDSDEENVMQMLQASQEKSNT